jgi:hypothetical protein
MALDVWKTADKLRRRIRQRETTIGAVATMLLAVATAAVTYLYY